MSQTVERSGLVFLEVTIKKKYSDYIYSSCSETLYYLLKYYPHIPQLLPHTTIRLVIWLVCKLLGEMWEYFNTIHLIFSAEVML